MNNSQTIGSIIGSHVSGVNNYGLSNGQGSSIPKCIKPKCIRVHRIILYALCISSLILSSIALSIAFPRKMDIDYIGMILGISSLLTAILMWWNIYAFIDMKSIKEEMSRRDTAMNSYIESEINRSLIQEETTCVRTLYKELGWIKILPIMTNLTFRSIRVCKAYGECNDIGLFVETIGQMIDEIKKEEIADTSLTGFMTLFRELKPYNSRVVLICQEYEKKKRGNRPKADYMSLR